MSTETGNKPTRGMVLEWSEEVGFGRLMKGGGLPTMWHGQPIELLEGLAALAYAAGMESMRIELQTELQRLITQANAAEKWRGIALARDGDGRTVQEIQKEAVEAKRQSMKRGNNVTNHDAQEGA